LTPTPDNGGTLRLVINGAELSGVKAGTTWFFTSVVDGVPTNHPGTESPAPVVEACTRAALAADPGVVESLRQLAAMLDVVVKGGAK
jgi:hypothetical protein